jgi:hypothetical protein
MRYKYAWLTSCDVECTFYQYPSMITHRDLNTQLKDDFRGSLQQHFISVRNTVKVWWVHCVIKSNYWEGKALGRQTDGQAWLLHTHIAKISKKNKKMK